MIHRSSLGLPIGKRNGATAFKTLVDEAAPAADADVRDTLIRDADAMTERLGGSVSRAGVRANGGKPVKGTGRLAEDPARGSPDRPL
jgi:cytochrome c